MSITRLSGGLTPGDGSDPRTFPEIFNGVADTVESQGSAITGAESDIDTLEAKNIPTFGTATPSDGQVLTFDSASSEYVPEDAAGGLPGNAFAFVETVHFTSNGTFSKSDFPFLRAIKVRATGAGAGGGRSTSTRSAGGGGAGATAEKFITDIAGLGSSVTVTVGAGGLGATTDTTNGAVGGNSEFVAAVSVTGGGGGTQNSSSLSGGDGGTASGGDLNIDGGDADSGTLTAAQTAGSGGASIYGGGGGTRHGTSTDLAGRSGRAFGSGGAGGRGAADGGDGADGIVVVELFA